MWDIFNRLLKYPVLVTETTYGHAKIQTMLSNDQFDLVIVSQVLAASGYAFAWHFNATLGLFSPASLLPGFASVLGDSDHTEYVPNILFEFTNRMTLVERIINTISVKAFSFFFNEWHKKSIHEIQKRYLPGCPSVDQLEKDISLVFTNSHPIFNYARTMTPEIIEIGAIHCRPAQPLPTVRIILSNNNSTHFSALFSPLISLRIWTSSCRTKQDSSSLQWALRSR